MNNLYEYNLGIRFERIASTFSKNFAVIFSSHQKDKFTYKELNSRSNQIAHYLLEKNLKLGDVVCIEGIKNLNTFACMLACLKIGAIYTMIDPDSPLERIKKIISKVNPKTLFFVSKISDSLKYFCDEKRIKIIINDKSFVDNKLSQLSKKNLSVVKMIPGSNPAYIMFTSGSTGFPKGAVMTHQNVLNLINWAIKEYHIEDSEILTNVNPLYFDNSVFDFYVALFSGASLAPFPKETVTNPKLLLDHIDEIKCTSWFSVPSMLLFLDTMKLFSSKNFKYLKRVIFGGEGYPKAKLIKLFETYSHKLEIYNVYGPTECTCICSSYQLSASDFEDLNGLPPLGNIGDNFNYLILNEKNNPVEKGEIGELCLLGPNVGKGYFNDEERTQKSFVQNPMNKSYSEVIYKTGDMVSYNKKDKKIYIHGRKDNQIKHMGYRIELEEIEAALSCIKYVSQSIVMQKQEKGLSQLFAVVSLSKNVNESKLREDLKKIIPNYMIPSIFRFEDHLPKNQNGKIDRVKLINKYLGVENE